MAVAAEGKDSATEAAWSSYRGGNARAGFSPTKLPLELEQLWAFAPDQGPAPAWPPPARGSYWQRLAGIAPRVVDDHTFHPVVAENRVLFGSSADDSVYCLDADNGSVKWRFTADGPVRYAPAVNGERVYFGSDDGSVYCLNLGDGEILWRKRLAPTDRVIAGNGRLISAWPVRTGVAVVDDVVYAAAGLYPSQKVFMCALSADNGAVAWRKEIDYTAHGYLLVSKDRLIVPTGRSTPIALDRNNGRFLGQLSGSPGTFAVVSKHEVLSGRGNDDSLEASDLDSHESLVSMPGKHLCVTPELSYLLGHGRLQAVDLSRFMELTRQLNRQSDKRDEQIEIVKQLRRSGAKDNEELKFARRVLEEQTESIQAIRTKRDECFRWQAETSCGGCLATAGNVVVLGGQGSVELRDRRDGRLLDELPIEGVALGVAISANRLYVSNEAGRVVCFAKAAQVAVSIPAIAAAVEKNQPNPWKQPVDEFVDERLKPTFGSTKGYALVLGAGDVQLLQALCRQTELTILAVDNEEEIVQAARDELLRRGCYGRRVAVRHAEAGKLPTADYVANVVISTMGLHGNKDDRWSRDEIMRTVRPAGGYAWLDQQKPPQQRAPLQGAGRWVHQYGSPANTAASDDRYIDSNLQLQWFGGPGPARMVDRHLRAPAPLACDGRMFISGENSILCIDSFHGTEYWRLDVPAAQRYSMPYDCGYSSVDGELLATAVRDSAWLIDVRTGRVKEKLPLPHVDSPEDLHWGYLALHNDHLIGSVQKAAASRTEPSRDLIDRDFNNDRPVVTGIGLFRMDLTTREARWHHESVVLNPTITVDRDRLYFVASANDALRDHPTGRISVRDLLTEGAELKALDVATGTVIWRRPLDPYLTACRNILYLQSAGDRLVLSGSFERDNDSFYRVAVLDADSADTIWTAEHRKGEPGEFTHGEQVHHPVILGDRLVCEPAIYEIASGKRIAPNGAPSDWMLVRPAHSCGTMSGAGNCLFFRSGNPTVMSLAAELNGRERFQSISPSRPGCWINIIPADGLVLIPEASASCVCHYSLQTSMAFQPMRENRDADP